MLLQSSFKSRCAHLVLAFVLVVWPVFAAAADSGAPSQTFEAASQKAAAESRLILLEFFSYNSAESKMLRDRVLAAAPVSEMLAGKFLVVPVEIERQPDLARRFAVSHPGVFVIVSAAGAEIDRFGGNTTPEQFVQFLEAGIAGRSLLDSIRQKASATGAGVESHFALGQAYIKRRQTQLALQEFAWCLEQGPSADPQGYRRYLTALIGRVKILSSELPAAKTLLETQRTKLQADAENNPNAATYQLLFKFNTALKQSSRNAEAYLALPADAALRGQLFGEVFSALVEHRKYREAAAAVDLESFVGRIYPLVPDEHSEAPEESIGLEGKHDPQALHRQRVADLTVPAVEALLGAGFPEKARRIAGRALDLDPSRSLRVRLIEATQRATPGASAFSDWIKGYQSPAAAAGAP
jgi:thioredoxin-like negative regulator of GroEL